MARVGEVRDILGKGKWGKESGENRATFSRIAGLGLSTEGSALGKGQPGWRGP